MHARILRYIDEIVRCGSIRGAADRLNVASSAINRQVLALEEELGTPLFHRLPRGLRLTSAGEILIAHVRATLREHEAVKARIDGLKGLRTGTVRVAAMRGLAGSLLPRVALAFRERYPGVNIKVDGLVMGEIIHAISEGEADIGLGYNMPADSGLHVIEMFKARLGAVMRVGHPLAAAQTPLRPSDLKPYPLALATEIYTIRRLIAGVFRRANLPLQLAFETDSLDMMKSLARTSDTITFLSRPDVAADEEDGLLVFRPLLDPALNHQPLAVVQRTNAVLDLAPGLFAERLREALRRVPD